MRNFFKTFVAMRSIAIIAMVAVIGFGVIGCDGDDNGGNGGGGLNIGDTFTEGDFTFIYREDKVELIGWNGTGTTVVIPGTVKDKPVHISSINNSCPFSNKSLTSVTISDGVRSIGNNAFEQNELTSVIIPNSVTTIGSGAFMSNQLTNVTISNSINSIESSVFSNNQLTNVTIPNSVTTIERSVFGNWEGEQQQLTSVTIGENITIEGFSTTGYAHEYGFPYDFKNAYETVNSKAAGTYTRPDTTSTTWTKQ